MIKKIKALESTKYWHKNVQKMESSLNQRLVYIILVIKIWKNLITRVFFDDGYIINML